MLFSLFKKFQALVMQNYVEQLQIGGKADMYMYQKYILTSMYAYA